MFLTQSAIKLCETVAGETFGWDPALILVIKVVELYVVIDEKVQIQRGHCCPKGSVALIPKVIMLEEVLVAMAGKGCKVTKFACMRTFEEFACIQWR